MTSLRLTPMRRVLALAAGFLLLVPAPGLAATIDVGIGDDYRFRPFLVKARVGDRVHWSKSFTQQPHNVREAGTPTLFRSGDITVGRIDFTRTFSAGSFSYFCEVHRDVRMAGRVRVGVRIGRAPRRLPFTVRWAGRRTNTGRRFDVQFRRGSGAWRNWRTNTTTFADVFGKRGRPVRIVPGATYSFRARSQKTVGAKTHQSRWSPSRSFRP